MISELNLIPIVGNDKQSTSYNVELYLPSKFGTHKKIENEDTFITNKFDKNHRITLPTSKTNMNNLAKRVESSEIHSDRVVKIL